MLGILVNMEKFSKIKGIAAPMLSSDGNQFSMMINIDTDMIIPKQFLKTIKRTGLGKSLFHEMRYDFEGNEIESFILNKDIYRDSKIILQEITLDAVPVVNMLHGPCLILVLE